MRRADRLFRIVQMLRSGRLQTGTQLAVKLEVSTRTLYRDIADLQASGVLIEGEPGVGYTLRQEMDLPPMQFTADETAALVLGVRMATAWGGTQIARSAKEALRKIEAVLPTHMQREMDTVQMYAPSHTLPRRFRDLLDQLHAACVQLRCVEFTYGTPDGRITQRRVRPLALAFWGGVWTMATWDEKRGDFRSFRVDRILEAQPNGEMYEPKRGQGLKDFLRREIPASELRSLGLER